MLVRLLELELLTSTISSSKLSQGRLVSLITAMNRSVFPDKIFDTESAVTGSDVLLVFPTTNMLSLDIFSIATTSVNPILPDCRI